MRPVAPCIHPRLKHLLTGKRADHRDQNVSNDFLIRLRFGDGLVRHLVQKEFMQALDVISRARKLLSHQLLDKRVFGHVVQAAQLRIALGLLRSPFGFREEKMADFVIDEALNCHEQVIGRIVRNVRNVHLNGIALEVVLHIGARTLLRDR